MPKPIGLDPLFRIVTPSSVEDSIWDAAEEAERTGWDKRRFIAECDEAWDQAVQDAADERKKIR